MEKEYVYERMGDFSFEKNGYAEIDFLINTLQNLKLHKATHVYFGASDECPEIAAIGYTKRAESDAEFAIRAKRKENNLNKMKQRELEKLKRLKEKYDSKQ